MPGVKLSFERLGRENIAEKTVKKDFLMQEMGTGVSSGEAAGQATVPFSNKASRGRYFKSPMPFLKKICIL